MKMPIAYNMTACAAHGYNFSSCWLNYTINAINNTNPNIIGAVQVNLPWFGFGVWLITYTALFILFNKSGGREKFMAIGIGGFLASIAYAQIGLFGAAGSTAEISVFVLSFFVLILSIIAYALVKDSGE